MCLHRLPEALAALAEEAAKQAIPAQPSGHEDVAGVLVPHTGHEHRQVSRSPG